MKQCPHPTPSRWCYWPLPHEEGGAKPHNTRPLSVIGWNTIYFGFEWLVVPFVFVCNLGAQAAYRDAFFDGLLMGRAASGS